MDEDEVRGLQIEVWALRSLVFSFARQFSAQAMAAETEIRMLGEQLSKHQDFQTPMGRSHAAALVRLAESFAAEIGLQANLPAPPS